MKNLLQKSIVLIGLIASLGIAAAQDGSIGKQSGSGAEQNAGNADTQRNGGPQLNAAQKTTILQIIASERVKFPVPSHLHLTVGAQVPGSVELYTLPPNVVSSIPTAEQYKFTVTEDHRIVLVDPGTMKVVEIIRR
jgi:hypothetical protein